MSKYVKTASGPSVASSVQGLRSLATAGASGGSSIGDSLTSMTQGIFLSLKNGQSPIAIATDNIRIIVSKTLISDLNGAFLQAPQTDAESSYGVVPSTVQLGDASACDSGSGYAHLSLALWGKNPYPNATSIQSQLFRFVSNFGEGGGNAPSASAEKSYYYVSLQFTTKQNFNRTEMDYIKTHHLRSNLTFPECGIFDGVSSYVSCGNCNVSTYTNYNVTFVCVGVENLCSSSGSATTRRRLAGDDDLFSDDSTKVGSGLSIQQYGILLKGLEETFVDVLSENPFAIDFDQAKAVVIMDACLIFIFFIGSIYFITWDEYDRHQLMYANQWPPKNPNSLSKIKNMIKKKKLKDYEFSLENKGPSIEEILEEDQRRYSRSKSNISLGVSPAPSYDSPLLLENGVNDVQNVITRDVRPAITRNNSKRFVSQLNRGESTNGLSRQLSSIKMERKASSGSLNSRKLERQMSQNSDLISSSSSKRKSKDSQQNLVFSSNISVFFDLVIPDILEKISFFSFMKSMTVKHEYLTLFFRASSQITRFSRWTNLFSNVLVSLFVSTLFFGTFYKNDGSCQQYLTELDCLLPYNRYVAQNSCQWIEGESNIADGYCRLNSPPNNVSFTVIVALTCVLIGLPIQLFLSYIIDYYCVRRPRLEEIGLSTSYWFGNGASLSQIHDIQDTRISLLQENFLQAEKLFAAKSAQDMNNSKLDSDKRNSTELVKLIGGSETHLAASLVYLLNKKRRNHFKKFLEAMKQYRILTFSSAQTIDEEIRFILYSVQKHYSSVNFQIQNLSSVQLTAWKDSYEATNKAVYKKLGLTSSGTFHWMKFWEFFIYRSGRNRLQSVLRQTRRRSEDVERELNEMATISTQLKEVIFLNKFVLEQFSPFKRWILETQLLCFQGFIPRTINPFKWLAAWVFVLGSFAFFLYWILLWGISNGDILMKNWGLNFCIDFIQDFFFVQIAKVAVVYLVASLSIREQLQTIRFHLHSLAMSYIQGNIPLRKYLNASTSNYFSVFQHLSPACRVAWSRPEDENLVMSKLLRQMDDYDILKCRMHDDSKLGLVSILVIIVPIAIAFFGETGGEAAIEAVLPALSSGFVVGHYYLYSISLMLLFVPYFVIVGLVLWYFGIFKTTKKYLRHERNVVASEDFEDIGPLQFSASSSSISSLAPGTVSYYYYKIKTVLTRNRNSQRVSVWSAKKPTPSVRREFYYSLIQPIVLFLGIMTNPFYLYYRYFKENPFKRNNEWKMMNLPDTLQARTFFDEIIEDEEEELDEDDDEVDDGSIQLSFKLSHSKRRAPNAQKMSAIEMLQSEMSKRLHNVNLHGDESDFLESPEKMELSNIYRSNRDPFSNSSDEPAGQANKNNSLRPVDAAKFVFREYGVSTSQYNFQSPLHQQHPIGSRSTSNYFTKSRLNSQELLSEDNQESKYVAKSIRLDNTRSRYYQFMKNLVEASVVNLETNGNRNSVKSPTFFSPKSITSAVEQGKAIYGEGMGSLILPDQIIALKQGTSEQILKQVNKPESNRLSQRIDALLSPVNSPTNKTAIKKDEEKESKLNLENIQSDLIFHNENYESLMFPTERNYVTNLINKSFFRLPKKPDLDLLNKELLAQERPGFSEEKREEKEDDARSSSPRSASHAKLSHFENPLWKSPGSPSSPMSPSTPTYARTQLPSPSSKLTSQKQPQKSEVYKFPSFTISSPRMASGRNVESIARPSPANKNNSINNNNNNVAVKQQSSLWVGKKFPASYRRDLSLSSIYQQEKEFLADIHIATIQFIIMYLQVLFPVSQENYEMMAVKVIFQNYNIPITIKDLKTLLSNVWEVYYPFGEPLTTEERALVMQEFSDFILMFYSEEIYVELVVFIEWFQLLIIKFLKFHVYVLKHKIGLLQASKNSSMNTANNRYSVTMNDQKRASGLSAEHYETLLNNSILHKLRLKQRKLMRQREEELKKQEEEAKLQAIPVPPVLRPVSANNNPQSPQQQQFYENKAAKFLSERIQSMNSSFYSSLALPPKQTKFAEKKDDKVMDELTTGYYQHYGESYDNEIPKIVEKAKQAAKLAKEGVPEEEQEVGEATANDGDYHYALFKRIQEQQIQSLKQHYLPQQSMTSTSSSSASFSHYSKRFDDEKVDEDEDDSRLNRAFSPTTGVDDELFAKIQDAVEDRVANEIALENFLSGKGGDQDLYEEAEGDKRDNHSGTSNYEDDENLQFNFGSFYAGNDDDIFQSPQAQQQSLQTESDDNYHPTFGNRKMKSMMVSNNPLFSKIPSQYGEEETMEFAAAKKKEMKAAPEQRKLRDSIAESALSMYNPLAQKKKSDRLQKDLGSAESNRSNDDLLVPGKLRSSSRDSSSIGDDSVVLGDLDLDEVKANDTKDINDNDVMIERLRFGDEKTEENEKEVEEAEVVDILQNEEYNDKDNNPPAEEEKAVQEDSDKLPLELVQQAEPDNEEQVEVNIVQDETEAEIQPAEVAVLSLLEVKQEENQLKIAAVTQEFETVVEQQTTADLVGDDDQILPLRESSSFVDNEVNLETEEIELVIPVTEEEEEVVVVLEEVMEEMQLSPSPLPKPEEEEQQELQQLEEKDEKEPPVDETDETSDNETNLDFFTEVEEMKDRENKQYDHHQLGNVHPFDESDHSQEDEEEGEIR
jgi:hypothetical protein